MSETTSNNPSKPSMEDSGSIAGIQRRYTPLSRFRRWFTGGGEYKPVFIVVAFVIFFLILNMPTPQSMVDLLTRPDPIGYETEQGHSIVQHLSEYFHDPDFTFDVAVASVKH